MHHVVNQHHSKRAGAGGVVAQALTEQTLLPKGRRV